jgi:K(+)-stimulated pyrophosphate-energized sodium pump
MLPEGDLNYEDGILLEMGVFYAILVGTVVGAIMSIVTEYYTAMGKAPVMSIIQQSSTGHATNIIGGLSIGMKSTVIPILTLSWWYHGFILFCRFIWCGYCCCRYDGNYCYAISY